MDARLNASNALMPDLPVSTSVPIKLVISGPVGAGKTTFIRQVSQTPVVDTDESASEAIGKATTTVALDFGTLTVDEAVLHLFGTPGQDRFDYMWEILCEGASGLLLLVAGDRPQDFSRARSILEFVTSQIPIPYLIGVTRQDLHRVWQAPEVGDFFEVPDDQVVGLNTHEPRDCLFALSQLFQTIQHQAVGSES